uniref:Uncharacterized protein n=1 Tax=Rhizophora mucronata TaxID=61149 RepID=A0A2P2QEH9_RHIMU
MNSEQYPGWRTKGNHRIEGERTLLDTIYNPLVLSHFEISIIMF